MSPSRRPPRANHDDPAQRHVSHRHHRGVGSTDNAATGATTAGPPPTTRASGGNRVQTSCRMAERSSPRNAPSTRSAVSRREPGTPWLECAAVIVTAVACSVAIATVEAGGPPLLVPAGSADAGGRTSAAIESQLATPAALTPFTVPRPASAPPPQPEPAVVVTKAIPARAAAAPRPSMQPPSMRAVRSPSVSPMTVTGSTQAPAPEVLPLATETAAGAEHGAGAGDGGAEHGEAGKGASPPAHAAAPHHAGNGASSGDRSHPPGQANGWDRD